MEVGLRPIGAYRGLRPGGKSECGSGNLEVGSGKLDVGSRNAEGGMVKR